MAQKREVPYAEEDCPVRAAFLAKLMMRRQGVPVPEVAAIATPTTTTTAAVLPSSKDKPLFRSECAVCGTLVVSAWEHTKFCSRRCKYTAKVQAARAAKLAASVQPTCNRCGAPRAHGHSRYCSEACRMAQKREHWRINSRKNLERKRNAKKTS